MSKPESSLTFRSSLRNLGAEKDVHLNAHAEGKLLEAITTMETDASALIQRAAQTANISARGYFRILRTARTIADLDAIISGQHFEAINKKHVAEALSYRRHVSV